MFMILEKSKTVLKITKKKYPLMDFEINNS
jgi:hypothetical protein